VKKYNLLLHDMLAAREIVCDGENKSLSPALLHFFGESIKK
jgi:hypothetical protein